MAVYEYKARTRGGEMLRDRMEGADRASVVAALRRRGLLVIDVRERRAGRGALLEAFSGKRSRDLVVFTRQFATMIAAGLPVVHALRILLEQAEGGELREAVAAVRADVEGGLDLSEALGRREHIFGRLYVEMVRAGEVGGVLDEMLLRVASRLEGEADLRRKVRSALAYPLVVLLLALLSAVFMLVFIVPIFARMYADLGGTLPLPTRVAMALSDGLTGLGGVALALALAGAAAYFLRWRKTEKGRGVLDRASLRIPLKIGDVVRKVSLARFARTFGVLSAAGVPILQAMQVTAVSSGNRVVEEALMRCRHSVRGGASIHEPLQAEPVFPPMVTRMIAVGEETGNLDGMLQKVAEFYEAEVDATVEALTSIIEPLMVVVVGAIVGGIIIAMYLPMFRIFELIG